MFHLATFIAGAIFVTSASAQILETKEYRGQQVACGRSGLVGAYYYCGTDGGYSEVFTGTVITSEMPPAQALFTDRKVRVHVDEVFRGRPPAEEVLVTDAQPCLGEMHAGERWLFFAKKDEKSGAPRVYYASGTKPVKDATELLELLRLQAQEPNRGLIQGRLETSDDPADALDLFSFAFGGPEKRSSLAEYQVRLHSEEGTDLVTTTDKNGRFQFAGLKPGMYSVDMNTKPGLWVEPQQVDVSPLSCADIQRIVVKDGSISGRWTRADGSPIDSETVEAVALDVSREGATPTHPHVSTQTNGEGQFIFHGLPAGRYEIIHREDVQEGPNAPTLYYPGTVREDQAATILLETGESRSGLRMTCPKGTSTPPCPQDH